MARIPRRLLVEKNSINHCTWRSHGHARVLESDEARREFLGFMRNYKEKFGIEILSYCLMGTHPHVTCRATLGQAAFSEFWKMVNWEFACWYNARTEGRGQVVRERMRSPRIQDDRHHLTVMRYGDLNPVRAGLVHRASKWKWSSFRHYAYGEPDDLITDAPAYLALGPTAPQRRAAYLHIFASSRSKELMTRRCDLVDAPFIGDEAWIAGCRWACGLSPPLTA